VRALHLTIFEKPGNMEYFKDSTDTSSSYITRKFRVLEKIIKFQVLISKDNRFAA
jgi:hypothetical protein